MKSGQEIINDHAIDPGYNDMGSLCLWFDDDSRLIIDGDEEQKCRKILCFDLPHFIQICRDRYCAIYYSPEETREEYGMPV